MDATYNDLEKRKQIGNRLREAIKASPYTQEAFANACGITYQTLLTYIKGKSYYRVDVLIRAADLLDVSYKYLLCEEDKTISFADKLVEKTYLSKQSANKLIEMGLDYNTSDESKYNINTLDIVLKDKSILEKLRNYFLFIRNKTRIISPLNFRIGKTNDSWEYSFIFDKLEQYINRDRNYENVETILLVDLLKEIETIANQKLLNKNTKKKEE